MSRQAKIKKLKTPSILQTDEIKEAIKRAYAIELALDRELCKKSFIHFVKKFWPVVEPGVPFVDGFHIHVIAAHLEAVSNFKISKLIINIPPRHMKSILAGVLFPAWVWATRPERKFLYCAYAESLAVRDSVRTRDLIKSDLYQKTFAPTWALKDDVNLKRNFENTVGGARYSSGVGGALTGMGGDHLFIDDPINAVDVVSSVMREQVNLWHDTAFSTRYNDPNKHTKTVIMQRLHEGDLTGHLLAKTTGGKYEHLVMPARYNPDSIIKSKTSLNYIDPRNKKNDLLWPERFNEKTLVDLEAHINRFDDSAEAQLQQDPKPRKGGLFPRDHWQLFEKTPDPILEIYQFIDAAQKPGITNDYSVIATWAKTHNGFYLMDLWRDKVDMPMLEEIVKINASKWSPNAIIIEDKSGGSSLIQYLLRSTTLPVIPYDPGQRDKEIRATAATPTVKAKKCFLPKHASWLHDFISEHEKFPKGAHDDIVDTTSMMVEFWSRRTGLEPRIRTL